MPTYEYLCKGCGEEYEFDQRITEDPIKECIKCGSPEVERLISNTSFQLKGTGWYKTDYSSSSSAGSAKSNSTTTSKESTTSGKKESSAKEESTNTTSSERSKSSKNSSASKGES